MGKETEKTLAEVKDLSDYCVRFLPSEVIDRLETQRETYEEIYKENLSDESMLKELNEKLTVLKNDFQVEILNFLINDNKKENIVLELKGYKEHIKNPFKVISLEKMNDIINKYNKVTQLIVEEKKLYNEILSINEHLKSLLKDKETANLPSNNFIQQELTNIDSIKKELKELNKDNKNSSSQIMISLKKEKENLSGKEIISRMNTLIASDKEYLKKAEQFSQHIKESLTKIDNKINEVTKKKELAGLKENYNVIKETTPIIYGSYGKDQDPNFVSKDKKAQELLAAHTHLMGEYNNRVKETENKLANIDNENHNNIEKLNAKSDIYKEAISDLEEINIKLADKLATSFGPVAMFHKRIQSLKKLINGDSVLSSVAPILQLDELKSSIQAVENDFYKDLKSAEILQLDLDLDSSYLRSGINSAEKKFALIKDAINKTISEREGSPIKLRVDEMIYSLNTPITSLNKHPKNAPIAAIFSGIKTELENHLENYVNLKTAPEIKLTSITVPAEDNKPTEDKLVPTETHPATKIKFVFPKEIKEENERTLIDGVAKTLKENLDKQQIRDLSRSHPMVKFAHKLVQFFCQFFKGKGRKQVASAMKQLTSLSKEMIQESEAQNTTVDSDQKFFKSTLEQKEKTKYLAHKHAISVIEDFIKDNEWEQKPGIAFSDEIPENIPLPIVYISRLINKYNSKPNKKKTADNLYKLYKNIRNKAEETLGTSSPEETSLKKFYETVVSDAYLVAKELDVVLDENNNKAKSPVFSKR